MRQKGKIVATIGQNGPYLIVDIVDSTIGEVARDADKSEQGSSLPRFVTKIVKI